MAPAFLIFLGATVVLQADSLPDEKVLLLPPVNFTIKVTGLAQVLLHWEPNSGQENRDVKLGYHVKIRCPQEDDYETRNTESRRVAALHDGFAASVRTIPWDHRALLASPWVSAELDTPPGSPGTSIMNLTCTTNTAANNRTHVRPYRVSLLCSWLAGREAPEDTQYFLYYRYGSRTEECPSYSQDTGHRNGTCWVPRTVIDSKGRDWLAVHVNGSSKRATIRPLDRLFALHAIDQVNPPGYLTVDLEGTWLSIQWEKPLSTFPAHCFDYEVKIYNARKGYFQMEKTTSNKFASKVRDASRYSVQARAAVSPVCRAGGLWSEWSLPVHVGKDEQTPWTQWLLAVLTAALCFLFVLSLTCRTRHLWTKLFPPVPAPKSNIKDFMIAIDSEKSGSRDTDIEVMSYVEESGLEVLEDCVF